MQRTDLATFRSDVAADPFRIMDARTFREAFRTANGRYPGANEWARYWDRHSDQFPGDRPWSEAKKRTEKAVRSAEEHWTREASKEAF